MHRWIINIAKLRYFLLVTKFPVGFAPTCASALASTFHDFSRHILHEWHEFNDSSLHESHEYHDFRKRKIRFFFARKSRISRFSQAKDTILLCTKGTNLTIFAGERHDSSLHEWHEFNDFRKRKTRFFFARMTRFSHFDKIVLSACRHRIIRVIRAKNRVIGLPILYHSCLSCYKRVLDNRVIGLPISCHSCVIIGNGMDFLIL